MRPFLIVIVVAMPACLPLLAHPTRVDEGIQLRIFASAGFVKDSAVSSTSPNVVPSIDFEASLQHRDTLRPEAFAVRLALDAGLAGVGGSVYTEFPRDWLGDMDAGIGYHGHVGLVKTHTAYLQFGRQNGTSRHWFVRNGATWMSGHSEPDRVVWTPMIGTSSGKPGWGSLMYIGGVVGAQVPAVHDCHNVECTSATGHKRTYLVLGMTYASRMIP